MPDQEDRCCDSTCSVLCQYVAAPLRGAPVGRKLSSSDARQNSAEAAQPQAARTLRLLGSHDRARAIRHVRTHRVPATLGANLGMCVGGENLEEGSVVE